MHFGLSDEDNVALLHPHTCDHKHAGPPIDTSFLNQDEYTKKQSCEIMQITIIRIQ